MRKTKKSKAIPSPSQVKNKPKGKTKPVWYLKVVSSNIAKAAYNFKKHQLMIAFHNGRRYVYENVNMYEWLAFSEAESQGQWFIENIRDEKPYKQLD